jgi:hypothetical protein
MYPSDLLASLAYDGRPRQFEGKFYASVGEETDAVRFFGNVRGMSEGFTKKDRKFSLHVDLTAAMNEGDITGSLDGMVYHETAYLRFSDVSIRPAQMSFEDANFLREIRQYQDRWFTLDLTEATSEFSQRNDIALTSDQWKEELNIILDTLFTMEHTRFKTGNSYLLTFNPNAWAETFTSAINNLETLDPDLADELSGEDMLPVLATAAETYTNALTVRLKVDTTNEGDFRFARIYATLNLPDEDTPVSLSFEGTVQHRPQPVYLDLPKHAEPLEKVFGDALPFLDLPTEPLPTEDWWTPSDTDEWEWTPSDTDDWEWYDDFEDEEKSTSSRPAPLPVPTATCSPDGSVRGIDLQLLEPCPGGRESRRSLRLRLEQ